MKSSGRFAFVTWCLIFSTACFLGCGDTTSDPPVAQLAGPQQDMVAAAEPAPQTHEVRKEQAPAAEDAEPVRSEVPEAGIPEVLLTSEHSAMCRVRVGDQFPAISLPKLTGGHADLASLQGKKATVVLFWQDDPWMSKAALEDLNKDVGVSGDVAVVGIAVKDAGSNLETTLKDAGATFPQLVDDDGKVFNQVGMVKMPRVYVLDATGRIVWFDIEYSQSTQRELRQALATLTASN